MERENIEKLMKEDPQYVREAIDDWFNKTPKEEQDRPAIGDIPNLTTYTSRQLYEKMMTLVKTGSVPTEGVAVDLLREILSSYKGK